MMENQYTTQATYLNTLRVGGVPEHFNHLWRLAVERGLFEKYGVRVEWTVQRCGTGEMIASVHRDDLDVIVALTEGVITDAAKSMMQAVKQSRQTANDSMAASGNTPRKNCLKILGSYVQSSLCWAVSCGPQCDGHQLSKSLDELKGKTWAISRLGSGSHLMAYVLAQTCGWNTRDGKDIKFHTAGDIHGLIDAVSSSGDGTDSIANLFMWETFTTKPWHDKGIVQRVGEFNTPWPCFVLACTEKTAKYRTKDLAAMFSALSEAAVIFNGEADTMPLIIAREYSLKKEDAEAWYKQVRIQPQPVFSASVVRQVYASIRGVGLLGDSAPEVGDIDAAQFVADNLCTLVETASI